MGLSIRKFAKELFGGAALLALATSGAAAQGPTDLTLAAAAASSIHEAPVAEVSVAVNKSRIIDSARTFREVSVGNSEIADVVPLTRTRFYVLGKKIGSTNVVLTDPGGRVIDVIDVNVGYDVDGLKRKIHEVAPGTGVEVRTASDSILLSGAVGDAKSAGAIAALADRYAPGRVTNMISVEGSQQVMLQVRFAEVQRSVLKDIGSNLQVRDLDAGAGGTGFLPPSLNPAHPLFPEFSGDTLDGVNPLNFFAGGATLIEAGDFALSVAFDVLEQKGLVRTLAEPNMVALSGDTASFLAGGEFPIPIAQSSLGGAAGFQAITVEFKEFGVGLSFTPTVLGDDSINLEMSAEVSSIDPTVSTTLGAITIPGLKVRRTNTTVELKDGQSFAIAGLIEDNLDEQIRQIPGLGSIPIIGALARSSDFERRQTELVVIITVRLVRPTTKERLASPTDRIIPPNEFDFFLLAKPEKVASVAGAGGVDGAYGYEMP